MSQDLTIVRSQFPALARPEVFLDNPGGTQMVHASIDRMQRMMIENNANSGGVFKTSQRNDEIVYETRQWVKDFFNAGRPEEIVFGANMTTLTYSISRALARSFNAGDTLVVTRMDHDGNISPWLQAAEDRNLKIRWVDFNPETGLLDLEDLQKALEEKPRLVAVGYASNSLGTINPIPEITKMVHEAGALVYVDAVQYAPHAPIDVQAVDCDFLVCSSYKFYGPHAGILYGKYDLLDALVPYKVRPCKDIVPDKFETGTGNFEAIAGVLGVLEYFEWLGRSFGEEYYEELAKKYSGRALTLKQAMHTLSLHDIDLNKKLYGVLKDIPGISIIGIKDEAMFDQRVPTFSFNIAGKQPKDIAIELAKEDIYIWAGNFYALEIARRFGRDAGFARVGAVHYNTAEEIDRFGRAVAKVAGK